MPRPPSPEDEAVIGYLFCTLCENELQRGLHPDETPETYARMSVAKTRSGYVVDCVRHNVCLLRLAARPIVSTHPGNDTTH